MRHEEFVEKFKGKSLLKCESCGFFSEKYQLSAIPKLDPMKHLSIYLVAPMPRA